MDTDNPETINTDNPETKPTATIEGFFFTQHLDKFFSVMENAPEETTLLLTAIRNYAFKGIELQPPSPVLAQFLIAKTAIDSVKNRDAEISQKRSVAGRKGAEARKLKLQKAKLRKEQRRQAVDAEENTDAGNAPTQQEATI